MCLDQVNRKITIKEGIGYQVFNVVEDKTRKNKLVSNCRSDSYAEVNKRDFVPIRQWEQDQAGYKIRASNGADYPSGFHIFTNLKMAKLWAGPDYSGVTIRKVKFKNVLAVGSQKVDTPMRGRIIIARVVIAKERLISGKDLNPEDD